LELPAPPQRGQGFSRGGERGVFDMRTVPNERDGFQEALARFIDEADKAVGRSCEMGFQPSTFATLRAWPLSDYVLVTVDDEFGNDQPWAKISRRTGNIFCPNRDEGVIPKREQIKGNIFSQRHGLEALNDERSAIRTKAADADDDDLSDEDFDAEFSEVLEEDD
jgi:hypothetical protein